MKNQYGLSIYQKPLPPSLPLLIIQMTNQALWWDLIRVNSSVNGILYCDKWTGLVGNH